MATETSTFTPFRVAIADAELADLRDRLARTRWPDAGPADTGWSVARRWTTSSASRAIGRASSIGATQEAALNAVPQSMTTIDGQPIHFLHARSDVEGALPLLLLHSWPGSPIEFARMLAPLTDPAGHGGDADDAFHVVVPSIPGFGYSVPVWKPAGRPGAWQGHSLSSCRVSAMSDMRRPVGISARASPAG